jgi:hypothetical protein
VTSRDWAGLASVYRAGAESTRDWTLNKDLQAHARMLDAMADRCDELADDRAAEEQQQRAPG